MTSRWLAAACVFWIFGAAAQTGDDPGVLDLEPDPGTLFELRAPDGAAAPPAARAAPAPDAGDPSPAEATDVEDLVEGEVLRVGFLPIIPNAALPVIAEGRWTQAEGYTVVPRQYVTSRAAIDALAAHEIDLAYLDGGPLVRAADRGARLQIIAGAAIDSVGLYISGAYAVDLDEPDIARAVRDRVFVSGKRITIASVERYSAATLALNGWVYDTLGLTEDEVRTPSGDLVPIWRSMLQNRMNAVVAAEPLLTALVARDPEGLVLVDGANMAASQPTAVVVAREDVVENHRDRVKSFLRAHRRATNILVDEPERAARAVAQHIGFRRLSLGETTAAIRNPINRFLVDPRRVIEPMRALNAKMRRAGLASADFPQFDLVNVSLFVEIEAEPDMAEDVDSEEETILDAQEPTGVITAN